MHDEEFTLKHIGVGTASVIGSLPLAFLFEYLGSGTGALATLVASGVAGLVWADEIAAFVQKKLPQLSEMDMQQTKQWLLSDGSVPMPKVLAKAQQAQEKSQSSRTLEHREEQDTSVPLTAETRAIVSRLLQSSAPHNTLPSQSQEQRRVGQGSYFPRDDENVTLRLGTVIATGERFDPHFNAIVGKGFIATAVQGSGKSQLCGLILEQADKCGVPAIALDHKGEYKGLKDIPGSNVLIAGQTKRHGTDFALTPDNADELVALMMKKRCRVIVDLPSFSMDKWLPRAEIVASLGLALMSYAAKQRQEGRRLLPCLVFLDEAQLYLPQDQTLLPPEATENKKVLSQLKNSYFSLVSNGRSNGYTMFFATQSLTYIAKWAIKSCQVQVYGRQVEKNALDMCEDIIEEHVATREQLQKLGKGVGIVYGLSDDPVIVQFDKKHAEDFSETPDIERLHISDSENDEEQDLEEELMRIFSRPEIDPDDERYSDYDTGPVDENVCDTEKHLATRLFQEKNLCDTDSSEKMSCDIPATRFLSQKKPCDVTATQLFPERISRDMDFSEKIVLGKDVTTKKDVAITQAEFEIAVNLRKCGMSTGYRDIGKPFGLSPHHSKALNKLVNERLGVSECEGE